MKLKEVNRGLVLGLVLLIGVVFHVNWQNHAFKKDLPVIRQTVEEYGQELLKSSLGDPKGYARRATSAVQNAFTGKGSIPDDICASKSMILAEIDSFDIDSAQGTLYAADFELKDLKAQKSGSGARVNIKYELDLTFSGMPVYMFLSGQSIYSPWGITDSDEKRRFQTEGSIDLYMIKDGGSWKILYVSYDFMNMEREQPVGDTPADDALEVNADE